MSRSRSPRRVPLIDELDMLLSLVDFDDLATDEIVALLVLLRPIVDRVQVQEERPPAQLHLLRSRPAEDRA
jgi:hypothetical protein